ncbi:MAG: antibiotic biosynthesis monooxygenase [Bacteroidetes bacterium 4572_77]|nr:MAG: antibiotic biosynthesis monooxygenase [Bacteroidetes bacterium 4572_77]
MIIDTPRPPYYAVIFTSIKDKEDKGYSEMADRMGALVQKQDGFLGVERAREEIGITVSYWKSLEAIQKWKQNEEHQFAQDKGKELWYKKYKIRIAKVDRDYGILD